MEKTHCEKCGKETGKMGHLSINFSGVKIVKISFQSCVECGQITNYKEVCYDDQTSEVPR